MRRTQPMAAWAVVVIDIVAIGVVLNVFALFHHVLPSQKSGGLNQVIVAADATPAPTAIADVVEAVETPVPESVALTPTPSPTPTPAPGDFSATYPDYDTSVGVDAIHSYQGEDKRIVVYSGKVDQATYYVADVWIRNIQSFKTGFAGGEFKRGIYDTTANIGNACGAIVALSGDYYGARHEGLVIRNGVLYRDSVAADVCILYADGVMETYRQRDFDLEAAIARGAYQSWSFGPKLLENGQALEKYSNGDIAERHPRAALGYFAPGHYCLVVIDGRAGEYSKGMTFTQMSNLFISLGCVDAYNLDGGQTAVMTWQGEIVNQPYKGGRAVSDIVYF